VPRVFAKGRFEFRCGPTCVPARQGDHAQPVVSFTCRLRLCGGLGEGTGTLVHASSLEEHAAVGEVVASEAPWRGLGEGHDQPARPDVEDVTVVHQGGTGDARAVVISPVSRAQIDQREPASGEGEARVLARETLVGGELRRVPSAPDHQAAGRDEELDAARPAFDDPQRGILRVHAAMMGAPGCL
jgi:hypothetical protein